MARFSLFGASSCTLKPVRTGNLHSLRSLIAGSNQREHAKLKPSDKLRVLVWRARPDSAHRWWAFSLRYTELALRAVANPCEQSKQKTPLM